MNHDKVRERIGRMLTKNVVEYLVMKGHKSCCSMSPSNAPMQAQKMGFNTIIKPRTNAGIMNHMRIGHKKMKLELTRFKLQMGTEIMCHPSRFLRFHWIVVAALSLTFELLHESFLNF